MAIFTGLSLASVFAIGSFISAALPYVLPLAITFGLGLVQKALAGNKPDAAVDGFSVQGKLQGGGAVPRSFNMGYSVTAGSLIYANTWGDPTDTPNAYFTQAIALSDIPGGNLVEVWVNGEMCSLGPVSNALLGAPVLQYRTDKGDHLWVRFHDGHQTTADELLVARAASTDRPYPSSRVGTGIAYVVMTAYVDDKLFTGFPQYKFAVSGIPLYDPSRDSTVGGSGPQRWADRSTWGGDGDNLPAVQIYNLLRGITYNDGWLYGLQAVTAPRVPTANWIAQIGKCRDEIQGETGLEATYRSGGQINVDAQIANAVEALLTACQGRLSEIGGFYKIHLGPPDSPTFSFTDADILSTEEQSFKPFFALADSVNGIAAKYPFPAEGWNIKAAPPQYRTDLEIKDGGRRLLANPSFDFVPYSAQVQRLMSSALEEAQRARTHTISLPPEYWIIEPGDVGQWSSARNGYVNKLFRVDGVVDRSNLDVGASVTEVDPSDYDWDHDADFEAVSLGPTVLPRPEAQGIRDWFAEGISINDPNGVARRPAIRLEWDGTVPGVDGIEYEIRLAFDHSDVTRGASPPGTFEVGAIIVSQSILPNVNYQARGRYVPTAPRDMTWSAWLNVTTPDVKLSLLDFENGLRDLVTDQFAQGNAAVARIEDLIASLMVDQDAANRLEKFKTREVIEYREAAINNAITGATQELAASIEQVSTIAASTQSVLASYIVTVNTSLGNLSSSVTTNATSISNLNSSFSNYTTTTNASIGSLQSSVTTTQTAVAGINGQLGAAWGVQLNVNNYVSGVRLVNGGATAAFVVSADVFQVAFPGVSGGAPQTVFQIANVNGGAKIAFRGDMFADGGITSRFMATGSITAQNGAIDALAVQSLNIGDNAVTVPISQNASGAYGGDGVTYSVVAGFSFNVDTTGLVGKPINVAVTFNTSLNYAGGANIYRIKIYGNGVNNNEWGGQNGEGFGVGVDDFIMYGNGGVMTMNIQVYMLMSLGTQSSARYLRALVTKR